MTYQVGRFWAMTWKKKQTIENKPENIRDRYCFAKIATRLNSVRGARRFTKPSQTDGKKSYCWALLMMA